MYICDFFFFQCSVVRHFVTPTYLTGNEECRTIEYLLYLFKINRTLRFAYKINHLYCIELPFGGHHICPIYGVPCKFGKDILEELDTYDVLQRAGLCEKKTVDFISKTEGPVYFEQVGI